MSKEVLDVQTTGYVQVEGELTQVPSITTTAIGSWTQTDTRRLDTCCDIDKGVIDIFDDLDCFIARDIASGIRDMIANDIKKITINISSYGGEASTALVIVDYLQMAKEKGIEIVTNALGVCCSGACDIFLMGDKRYISRRCYFLMHNTQLHADDSADNIRRDINAWEKIIKDLLKLVLKDTKVDVKYVMEKIKGKDWVLSSKECKKLGFAHEYLTKERTKNVRRKQPTKKDK